MKTHFQNKIVYFYTYFVVSLIFVFVHTYLPLYFYNVIKVEKSELAFVQIISYPALLIKPIISIYFNNLKKVKSIFIFSTLGITVTLFLTLLSLNLLLIFGVFLGINFAFTSVSDVVVDRILVEESVTEKQKSRNTLLLQLGAAFGSLVVPILNYLSFSSWALFFLMIFSTSIPLLIFSFFIINPSDIEKENKETIINDKLSSISVKNLILMIIFIFFIYASELYEYPFEPWVKGYLGGFFDLGVILMIIINTIGIILAGLISDNYDKKKILIYSSIISGVLLMFTPFVHIILFFIFFSIIQIFSGFLLINIISLMIDISKKQVLIFQIMAAAVVVAKIVFIPLGTFLSDFIITENIIYISGYLIVLSCIPLFFIKIDK